jgi:hypothetical protein
MWIDNDGDKINTITNRHTRASVKMMQVVEKTEGKNKNILHP